MHTLHFAVIGCGFIAAKHVQALGGMPGCKLAGVYDVDLAAARALAGGSGVTIYNSFREVLADPLVDVVSICTPADLHPVLGVEAARRGKHLLVEKPLAVDPAAAGVLIETCRRAGVVLAVAHQNRYKGPVQALKQVLADGLVGEVSHGAAVLRWNRNDEYYRQSPWRGDASRGGGVLLNQAVHIIDLLQWLLGPTREVYGGTRHFKPGIKAEETAVAVMRFHSGALGVLEACASVYPSSLEETLAVFGTRGTVILGGKGMGKVLRWDVQEVPDPPPDHRDDPDDPGGYRPLLADLAESIRTGRQPLVDGVEGCKPLHIIAALRQAGETGVPVVTADDQV